MQWIIPRSRGEPIPVRARRLEITVACPGVEALVRRTVTDRRAYRIAAMIDPLQTVQPDCDQCPSYPVEAPAATFTFRAVPGDAVLARASEPVYATEPTTRVIR